MKIFCYLPDFNQTVPPYVLSSRIDGISFPIPASSLFGISGSYNSITNLKTVIKQIGAANKKVTIAVVFGNSCGNEIFKNFPTLKFVRHHHQDASNQPLPIEVPVPYSTGYYEKVRDLIKYLSEELRKDNECWEAIENIKITGVNETTPELRMTAADFTDTNDLSEACQNGAIKWLNAGYEYDKVYKVCTDFIKLFSSVFYDKKVVQAFVPGKNGFPTISKFNLLCDPSARSKLTEEILSYGNVFSNFTSQHTAFDFNAKVPVYSKFVQLERLKYGNVTPDGDAATFKSLLGKAEASGKENLEIFSQNIVSYPEIFKA